MNLVLPRPLIIYNEAGFDITDEVTAQMNRVLRNVNMPAEGAEPPPPGAPAAQAAPPAAQPAAQPAQPRRN